jgi:tetratricopeptide (TPR) repeat protein
MPDRQAIELSRASTMIDLGRYADAARLLAGLLATAPDSSRGWCLLARAQLGAGDPVQSVAAATRASALNPADDWPYRLASTALISLGQTGAAVTAAQEGRRLAPHFWRTHVCVAEAATAHGQHELAASAAANALAMAPDIADVHVAAGKAALGRGDLAEARQRHQAALALEPAHSGAINELGRISLKSRDPAAAAAYFLQAAGTSPGSGIFGRNTDLALGRVALQIAVLAGLAVALGAAITQQALAGSALVAVVVALPGPALAIQLVRLIRRLPPAGRRNLPRLLRAMPVRLGRILGATIGGRLTAAHRGQQTSQKTHQGNAPTAG